MEYQQPLNVQNPSFTDADGFFTHSDMAWSALIRGSINVYRQRAEGDVRNDREYTECGSRIVRRMLMQRETSICRV